MSALPRDEAGAARLGAAARGGEPEPSLMEGFGRVARADPLLGAIVLASLGLHMPLACAIALAPGADIDWTRRGAPATVRRCDGQAQPVHGLSSADAVVEVLGLTAWERLGSPQRRLGEIDEAGALRSEAQVLEHVRELGGPVLAQALTRPQLPSGLAPARAAVWLRGQRPILGGSIEEHMAWEARRLAGGTQLALQWQPGLDTPAVVLAHAVARAAVEAHDTRALKRQQGVSVDTWSLVDAREIAMKLTDPIPDGAMAKMLEVAKRLTNQHDAQAAEAVVTAVGMALSLAGRLPQGLSAMTDAEYAWLVRNDIEIAAALLAASLVREPIRYASRRRALLDYCVEPGATAEEVPTLRVLWRGSQNEVRYQTAPRPLTQAARHAFEALQEFARTRGAPDVVRMVSAGAPRAVDGPLACLSRPDATPEDLAAADRLARHALMPLQRRAEILREHMAEGVANTLERWQKAASAIYDELCTLDARAAETVLAIVGLGLTQEEAAWLRVGRDLIRDAQGYLTDVVTSRRVARSGNPGDPLEVLSRPLAGDAEALADAADALEAVVRLRDGLDDPLYATGGLPARDTEQSLPRLREAIRAAAARAAGPDGPPGVYDTFHWVRYVPPRHAIARMRERVRQARAAVGSARGQPEG